MNEYSHTVSSFGLKVELRISSSVQFRAAIIEQSFWQEFIPGFAEAGNTAPIATWHITENDKCYYNLEKRTMRVSAAYAKAVVVVVEAEFERARQRKNLYTFHGTAIAKNDKAVGFIGNLSGIGKTSLAAFAASNGWHWVVDEKFTISEGHLVGGARGILNDVKTVQSSSGVRPSQLTSLPILMLLCCPIVGGEKSLIRYDLTYKQKCWLYYDEVTRDIRQVDGVLDGFAVPLSSFDVTEISVDRRASSRQLAESVPAVFLHGSKDEILREIDAIVV